MIAAEAARKVGRTSGWVTQLTRRYNERNAEAVSDRQSDAKPGPLPSVDAAAAVELASALRSEAPDGGLWTAPKVAAWIEERTGRAVHETTAWRVMRRLGFPLQVPRPRRRRARAGAV
jgi:transposase